MATGRDLPIARGVRFRVVRFNVEGPFQKPRSGFFRFWFRRDGQALVEGWGWGDFGLFLFRFFFFLAAVLTFGHVYLL